MYEEKLITYRLRDSWIYQYPPGGPVINLNPYVDTYKDYRSGSGVRGYKRLIKAAQNATSNFLGEKRTWEVQAFKGELSLINKYTHELGYYERYDSERTAFGGWVVPTSDMDTADNQAIKYILGALRQTRTQMQGMIFLAEAKKTMDMIKRPAKGLFQGLGDYFRTASSRASRAPKKSRRKIVADTWLEYSFGWVPLTSDIADAVKAYKSLLNKKVITKLTRTGKDEVSDLSVTPATAGNFPVIIDRRIYSKSSVRYIVALKQQITGFDPSTEVAERFGFVASQFIPTLWEICPWSFLVDYFTNIGDILDAGATSQSDIAWICKTRRGFGDVLQTTILNEAPLISYWSPYADVIVRGSSGQWHSRHTFVERSSPTNISMPRLGFEIPGTTTKWLNLGALAAGMGRARDTINR